MKTRHQTNPTHTTRHLDIHVSQTISIAPAPHDKSLTNAFDEDVTRERCKNKEPTVSLGMLEPGEVLLLLLVLEEPLVRCCSEDRLLF